MISYVDTVIKNWKSFAQVVTYDIYKPKHVRRSLRELRMIR
jgi:hypothetical protein